MIIMVISLYKTSFLVVLLKTLKANQSFRIQASGFRLQASGFRLQASGFRLQAYFTYV
jgi:hypothetical protein